MNNFENYEVIKELENLVEEKKTCVDSNRMIEIKHDIEFWFILLGQRYFKILKNQDVNLSLLKEFSIDENKTKSFPIPNGWGIK